MKTGCRFFLSDRPCKFHKKEGVECDNCQYFDGIKERILIIKLGEAGDVLRTTPLLHGIKEKYPNSYISWLVNEVSVPLLKYNPLIDRILIMNLETSLRLQKEKFDIVFNLDKEIASCALTEFIKADRKIGFGLNEKGHIYPLNKETEYKYKIGLSDKLNKQLKLNYPEQLFEITGIKPSRNEYILNLGDETFAEEFSKRNNLQGKTIIGLNTGCGSKFQPRKWPVEHYSGLVNLLHEKYPDVKILLLGGPDEMERNKIIEERCKNKVINIDHNSTILQFASLINLCDLVITSVTMGMHIAIALKKKLIVFMGPLVRAEINTYGLGPILTSDMGCLGCFKHSCDIKPSCMDNIPPKRVLEEVEKLLGDKLASS